MINFLNSLLFASIVYASSTISTPSLNSQTIPVLGDSVYQEQPYYPINNSYFVPEIQKFSTSTLIQQAFGTSTPIMDKISKCESEDRQWDSNGDVIKSHTDDYGYYQISHIHIKQAESMGIDIMTFQGNLEFAKYLFDTQGIRPWVCAHKLGLT